MVSVTYQVLSNIDCIEHERVFIFDSSCTTFFICLYFAKSKGQKGGSYFGMVTAQVP